MQSPTTALTVASWVYIEGWYNGWAAVCAKSDNSGNAQYGYAVNQSNGVYFDVQGTAVTILSSTAFSLDRWYHVACTWDGTQVKLFVNGQSAGSTPLARGPVVDARPLQIGRHTPGLTEYLHGTLDGLRIFNRALASEEISALAECPDVPESEAAGNCSDGIDNDCDGSIDSDPECGSGPCVGGAAAST